MVFIRDMVFLLMTLYSFVTAGQKRWRHGNSSIHETSVSAELQKVHSDCRERYLRFRGRGPASSR